MSDSWSRPLGIAVISFATLMHQLLLVRFVSARLLNNYAFLVVSLSMAGFAIGGLLLSLFGKRIAAHGQRALAPLFDAYALTLVVVWAVFGRLSLPAFMSSWTTLELLAPVALSLLLCVPFVFSGLIVGAYLSSEGSTGRLYAYDLAAAALGAVLSIVLVPSVGLELLAALTCVVVVVVRHVLSRAASRAENLFALAAIVVVANAVIAPRTLFELRPIPGSMHDYALARGGQIVDVRWDPSARIEFVEVKEGVIPEMFKQFPSVIGTDPSLLARYRAFLTQNNYAFAMLVDDEAPLPAFAGVNDTLYAAAYKLVEVRTKTPKAIAIGVGGGFDILTALVNGVREVTGVEINAATLEMLADRYRDKPKHFLHDPRVTLVRADGRHTVAKSDERYDVIQLSGVDSYSGSQGNAHVFSETYLYTKEAMHAYLDHLSDDGVINLLRIEHPTPREMLRVVATMVETLRERGVDDPERHIVVLGQVDQRMVTALLSKRPVTQDEVAHLRAWAERTPAITMLADPFDDGDPRSNHDVFLRRARLDTERSTYAEYPYDITAPTDDWPFFFQFSRWDHLRFALDENPPVAKPILHLTVVVLGVLLSLLMIVTVLIPLAVGARDGLRVSRPALHIAYFALLGVGFLVVEVHLMQRLSLLLGEQTLSVTVVLATLLLSSGLGAASTTRVLARLRAPRQLGFAFAAIALVLPLVEGPLASAIALPLAWRVVIAMVLTAPLGFLMGMFFPMGLDHLKASAPSFAPWAWGVNGAFSVLAPVVTIACAVTFGQTLTYLLAIPIYLAAGFLADQLGMWPPTRARR